LIEHLAERFERVESATFIRSFAKVISLGAVVGMSVCGVAGMTEVASASPNPPISANGDCNSITTCYTPHQIQVAYGVEPLLNRGIDGRGETIVLPELAYPIASVPVTDLRSDMRQFDRLFGLPAARLRFVDSLALVKEPWLANGEEVLDAEMAHTIAPGAVITVVMVAADSLDNAASAVTAAIASIRLGSTAGSVISISASGQAGGEHCDTRDEVTQLNSALEFAASHHVTVVAASGDVGSAGEPCDVLKGLIGGAFTPVKEVNLPASDPLVLAVGGTSLSANHKTGAYVHEIGWGLPYGQAGTQFQASGGGFSRLFARPTFQDGVKGIGATRGVPDVSADAAPHYGMSIVLSDGHSYTIRNSGGTSASAPIWAGVIALADQYAGRHLGDVDPTIYAIGRSASYHKAFHDVTSGDNAPKFSGMKISGYAATSGWDPVTGWGSPDAQFLVPLLADLDKGA
jgi:subtilase family serine protease